ncbi:hypothetical protein B0H10DRAFT_771678 [Mycena sp. CBHHK59/15]|nr:hypothetical protein B0H10DRAFT_771678 [Mycena sp. CBHHK59/15]
MTQLTTLQADRISAPAPTRPSTTTSARDHVLPPPFERPIYNASGEPPASRLDAPVTDHGVGYTQPVTVEVVGEEVKSPQTREDQVPRRDQVNALVQQSNSFASGALSVFRDGYVPVPLSLSPAEQAQWRFINRAVQEHLSRAPCFGALGTYMLDDNSLLQCVAYQEKPSFPPTQYDYPVLGSRTDDLCFEFFPRDPRPSTREALRDQSIYTS